MKFLKFLSLSIYLFLGSFIWTSSSSAMACDLGEIASDAINISLKLDLMPQNISVEKRYIFTEEDNQDSTNIKISEESFITFDNFTDIYTNFAALRVGPKDQCDKIILASFKTATSNTGLAFGRFIAKYEDRVCLGLRFFEPTPGVKKEPMSRRVSHGILEVQNAFQPKIDQGNITIVTATSYHGDGEASALSKLYRAPLTGFLQDTAFIQLINNTVSGSGENNAYPGFTVKKASFITREDHKTQLKIVSQKALPLKNTCHFRESILASNLWKPH